jgi:hypothetical protein
MVGPNGFEPSTSSVSRKRSRPTELRACCSYRAKNRRWRTIANLKQFTMPIPVYFLTAQAIPSGPLPVSIFPVTDNVFKSMTAI